MHRGKWIRGESSVLTFRVAAIDVQELTANDAPMAALHENARDQAKSELSEFVYRGLGGLGGGYGCGGR